jgi:rhodanese-related sulfurtransferase/predicted transcriptional regulator
MGVDISLFKCSIEHMGIMDSKATKRRVYEELASIPKALSNATRLHLIDLLAQAEKTVEMLARESEQSVANVSQHLQVLRNAGLVEVRREGTYGHYRLAGDDVHQLWRSVRTLGEARLAQMDRLLTDLHGDAGSLESVTLDELRSRMAEGAVLLDVRPHHEYAAGHIPDSMSIPIDELPDRIGELPDGAEIVAYCRGPYCVYADRAVELMRKRGIAAFRLDEGFPEWRAASLQTEGSRA